MQNSMVMFTFSVFDWNYLFWANFVQKIKFVNIGWNLVSRLIRMCRIQWWCSFFLFYLGWKNPFLDKLGPQGQNCQFKMKFGTYINSNMQNSMVVFSFSVLDWKHIFSADLIQKVKIVSLSRNLVLRLIWICRTQWRSLLFLF